MKPNIKETELVEKILKYLNSRPNCKADKNNGFVLSLGGRPAIDVSDNGRHGVIGVKVRPRGPTQMEEKELREWVAAGSMVMVANSVGQVKKQYPMEKQNESSTR